MNKARKIKARVHRAASVRTLNETPADTDDVHVPCRPLYLEIVSTFSARRLETSPASSGHELTRALSRVHDLTVSRLPSAGVVAVGPPT